MSQCQTLSIRLRLGAAAGTLALLAACGGGGGGGNVISTPNPQPAPSPVPAPSPTPTPTPTPTPPPATGFNTEEFRLSAGPAQHGATTAWQRGATGSGETIAIVDTGIDTDSPEFAGRIHPDSRDIAATRGFEAEDDHGTNVALVAAAARNNSGILGIAYDSRVLVLRADRVGSCGADTPENTNLTCSFFDSDIAKGIDQAVTSGATVINLSLGGGNPSAAVIGAARRASAAGVVIVIAAGNAGDGSTSGVDPNEPTSFARGIRDAGGDNVIIVGSVNESSQLSSFSQRAGSQANFFLTARGERVCCVYENGQIYVGRDPQGTFRLLFSGTSFAAPQVAGAVALLAQAFPNLTGAQIVQILLESARDLGDTGTDTTYGRGSLDITAAFAPRGTITLAGGTSVVRLGETGAVGSAAMGDAFAAPQDARGIVLDGYQRAYEYDFTANARGAVPEYRLHRALEPGTRQIGGGSEALSLAFTVGDRGLEADGGMPQQLRLSRGEAEDARVLARPDDRPRRARLAGRFRPARRGRGSDRASADHGARSRQRAPGLPYRA